MGNLKAFLTIGSEGVDFKVPISVLRVELIKILIAHVGGILKINKVLV